jgi:hypothetical protein
MTLEQKTKAIKRVMMDDRFARMGVAWRDGSPVGNR